MSERSDDRPHAPRADPTRDIRLPPLPDRPASAVPPEWSSYVPATDQPAPREAAPVPPAAAAVDRPSQRSVDEPTDRLASPSDDPLRQGTRAFTPQPSVHLLKVSVTPRRRRTTKVLWTLVFLTVAVIIACGIYLVIVVTQR